jgi:hypothetical protein
MPQEARVAERWEQGMADAEQVKLAAEAYIYGCPLVYDLKEVASFVEGGGSLPVQAPYNALASARQLLGPETKFVSPNNDTLYVGGQCDARQGPLVLHVPDTRDRHYVLQFVDAWTNNFAYIGRRATGTAEAQYLLTARDYDGPVPDAMTVVAAPTGCSPSSGGCSSTARPTCPPSTPSRTSSPSPLAVRAGGTAPAEVAGTPKPDPRVGEELGWWERFRVALAAFPPPPGDAPFLALAERLGATAAESPYVDPDPALAQVLVAGQQAGQAKIEELAKGGGDAPGGWSSALHLFDYNLDRLGLGTIDAPEWKIPDRAKAYGARAVAARAGLWGNHGYEADYAFAWTDSDGQPLDGANRYELRLESPPPVDAFWSLTMYDVPDFYLVANPIDRYSIGDRTPGLQAGSDGSVTIYLQSDSPGPGKEANWLPSPTGAFRPIMRMYQPQQPVLDGPMSCPRSGRSARGSFVGSRR